MDDELLFEIRTSNLETGMRGYPVGFCTTSAVDPFKGLFYVGHPVETLAQKSPEEVMFLLYYGRESSVNELQAFKKELCARATISADVLLQIQQLPRTGHPMKLLAAAVLILGMLEGVGQWQEDALRLIAKAPMLVAACINHHASWPETITCKPELGYIENFIYMLNLPKDKTPVLTQAMKLFHILHLDHGGGNLSTFVGKAVASGLEDMYGSMSSALCALEGPRHGRANQDCLEFVESILREVGPRASPEAVEAILRAKLDRGELVHGFGHAVLRVEDPRAACLFDFAREHFAEHPLVQVALTLREVGPKVLSENPKIYNPYPNVDPISGVVLTAAGFNYPSYISVLFGMSRMVGISRQIIYERCEARGGKGTPIIRPKYISSQDPTLSG